MKATSALAVLAQSIQEDSLAAPDGDPLSLGVWPFLLILSLILLNAFFVLAEFSLVKVRLSQVEDAIEEGSSRAKLTKRILGNLESYLSATQLGITLSSLALGLLLGHIVSLVLQAQPFGGEWHPVLLNSVVLAVTLAFVTLMHLIFGEMIPRSLAIRKALPMALTIAGPISVLYRFFKPALWLSSWAANGLLKGVFKVNPVSEMEVFHSADELKHLVSETERAQEVTEIEREILVNALELNDRVARDVMLPRAEVIWLDLNKDFETNQKKAVDSLHTRFPLVDGHLDHPEGLVHIKDLIKLSRSENPDLLTIKRRLEHIPELMPLDSLLKFFLTNKAHMALVVDEYGGSVGIVTLDNVLEELVGDIQDEFDEEEPEEDYFERLDEHSFVVDGTLALYELADYSDLDLEDPEVSTIGGYVTHQLGRLPEVGEEVEIEDYKAEVLESDGRSVGKLRFERTPEAIEAMLEDEREDALHSNGNGHSKDNEEEPQETVNRDEGRI